MKFRTTIMSCVVAAAVGASWPVLGQGSAVDEINRYRELLQDGNPADLWEARG